MASVFPSSHDGMGAVPYMGGTSFRVWAPHADQVYVTGTFNNWSKTANPLASEESGCWSADISGAKAGDQYKYLIVSGSTEFLRIDPYARDVTSSVGNGIIHDPQFDWGADEYETPPLHEMVIYEMHTGTFHDAPGGPPGDLKSAIEKLGYLKQLGINAVEVMPVMEFAGGFSWGYNPAYIFAVESDYGGPRAFKEFVKAAHGHGIAVIFDVVYNHFGPSDLDIWQLYRDLIHLRRNWHETTGGLCGQHLDVYHVNREGNVIAFHRWEHGGPQDSVIVVVNMSSQGYHGYRIGFPRDGHWKVRFNSDWVGYDPEFSDYPSEDAVTSPGEKDGMAGNADVHIGPYSVIILSQDE